MQKDLHNLLPGKPYVACCMKEMEANGLIRRIDFKEVPPHVEYELTERGTALKTVLQSIEQCGATRRESWQHQTTNR